MALALVAMASPSTPEPTIAPSRMVAAAATPLPPLPLLSALIDAAIVVGDCCCGGVLLVWLAPLVGLCVLLLFNVGDSGVICGDTCVGDAGVVIVAFCGCCCSMMAASD